MQPINAQLKDYLWFTGLGFIFLSLFFFCLPFFLETQRLDDLNLFIPNFLLAAIYFIIIWISGRLRKGREGLHLMIIFLILFFISAWSLNREMSVFENSTTWFSVLLVIVCANYVAFAFFESLSRGVQYVLCFVLGVGVTVFLYLSFYLLPLYAVSLAASPLLGISLHSFVPLLFLIYTLVLVNKASRINKRYWIGMVSGSGVVIVMVVVFMVQWAVVIRLINNTYRKASVAESEGLPEWVAVSQKLPTGSMAEKVVKAGLVYSVPATSSEFSFFVVPARNFDEELKHDPLVMISALFSGKSNLSNDERINVLESMFNSRHQAQDRLWSGENLYTENVQTTAQIWPQLSMAYTEKTITITNAALRSRSNQEEGIYTFHLPEGSVVTALSLWIEGKEEKGILTTKDKAEQAYKTIVGYERRDPSVVHWQEGNTVSVRVFPVISGTSRKFKIGITSPIGNRNEKLIYENIYFDGPDASSATEEVKLEFKQSPKDYVLSAVFSSENPTSFRHSGKYRPDWKIQFGRENISTESFTFDGNVYSVRPYQKQRATVSIGDVYLDINNLWTKQEFNDVVKLVGARNIYVFYSNDLIKLNDQNKDRLFLGLSNDQFSLFPFFKIIDSSNSLVITKSTAVSPNTDDLIESRFMKSLKEYFSQNKKIRLFNMGSELSPYLKTLKEYRAFQYEHGDFKLLQTLVNNGLFAMDIENDNQVIIDNAELAIVRSEGTMRSTAPDHLMRLFSYNHILQKMGSRFFTD